MQAASFAAHALGDDVPTPIADASGAEGTLSLLFGVGGVKLNVTRTLLLTVSVPFPLGSDGLRPKVTPVVGLDYPF